MKGQSDSRPHVSRASWRVGASLVGTNEGEDTPMQYGVELRTWGSVVRLLQGQARSAVGRSLWVQQERWAARAGRALALASESAIRKRVVTADPLVEKLLLRDGGDPSLIAGGLEWRWL